MKSIFEIILILAVIFMGCEIYKIKIRNNWQDQEIYDLWDTTVKINDRITLKEDL